MSREPKEPLSRDHVMEREGVAWESSVAAEDVFPYMPKEEYELRIQKAKTLLARHGIDAMAVFAYGNKQYYGGFQESNYRFTDRWRHCIIVSQEHDPVIWEQKMIKTDWEIAIVSSRRAIRALPTGVWATRDTAPTSSAASTSGTSFPRPWTICPSGAGTPT